MTSGNKSGVSSEINVTPLIDVLLVLLIIFMVIVPVVPRGIGAIVPQPPPSGTSIGDGDDIVVSVLHTTTSQLAYRINQQNVLKAELTGRLHAIYANRAERVMFVRGDDDVDFSEVAEVIDMGHSAGVDHIGLITPKIADGQ